MSRTCSISSPRRLARCMYTQLIHLSRRRRMLYTIGDRILGDRRRMLHTIASLMPSIKLAAGQPKVAWAQRLFRLPPLLFSVLMLNCFQSVFQDTAQRRSRHYTLWLLLQRSSISDAATTSCSHCLLPTASAVNDRRCCKA